MKRSSLSFCTHLLVNIVDGGTAWMARDSVIMDADMVDASSAAAPWWNLALQLKQDLTSIILMSEADLQVPTWCLDFYHSNSEMHTLVFLYRNKYFCLTDKKIQLLEKLFFFSVVTIFHIVSLESQMYWLKLNDRKTKVWYFQCLVDAPCSEIASALGFQETKAEELQQTLQRVLDRKEEERQSKELLQLYLKAVEKEDKQQEEQSQPSHQGTTVLFCGAIYSFVKDWLNFFIHSLKWFYS